MPYIHFKGKCLKNISVEVFQKIVENHKIWHFLKTSKKSSNDENLLSTIILSLYLCSNLFFFNFKKPIFLIFEQLVSFLNWKKAKIDQLPIYACWKRIEPACLQTLAASTRQTIETSRATLHKSTSLASHCIVSLSNCF